MGRVLIVVPPFTGHINPTIAVAQALRERGHQVAWCGYASVLSSLLPEGAELLPLAEEATTIQSVSKIRSHNVRGLKSLKFWQRLMW